MSKIQEERIKSLNEEVLHLQKSNEDKDLIIHDLRLKLEKSMNNTGRKSQVLDLLRRFKTISILEISQELNISTKNVSSQLTYLRSDGHMIFTDPNGRKMLVENKVEVDEEDVEVDEEEVEVE